MRLFFFVFACLLFSGVSAQNLPSNIKLNPAVPVGGTKVKITYNPEGTALAGMNEITVRALRFKGGDADVEAYTLSKRPYGYEASIDLPDSTDLLAFIFVAGEQKDDNKEEGYLVPVKPTKKSAVTSAHLSRAMYYNMYINYDFELPVQPEKALEHAEKAYKENPSSQSAIVAYVNNFTRVKGKEGEEEFKKLLQDIEADGNLNESNYSLFISYFTRMKETAIAEALKTKRNEKFPEGNWKVTEKMQSLAGIQDNAETEKEILSLLQDEKFSSFKTRLYYMLLEQYKEEGNQEKLNNLIASAPIKDVHSTYNDVAWNMAENDEDIDLAEKLSAAATEWAKNNIDHPDEKKPYYYSTADWKKTRQYIYSMYADTYSFILYKKGEYQKGFPYAKEAAEIREFKSPDYNDRYALLLEKVARPADVVNELEKLVAKGAAGSSTFEVLKKAYLATNKTEAQFESYFAGLKQQAKEHRKKELAAKLINEPAEDFSLVNLEGKKVSLADYKGKTVVLDFWATWCGPCIASFPGMQKAVEKYRANDKVAFLFIDTWENGEDREQKVKEFIAKNNYSFHVLFDTPQKADPDQFEVVSRYKVQGIPTKFVIDGNGNVRFKSVGFGGSTDGLVDELEAMIELVQQ